MHNLARAFFYKKKSKKISVFSPSPADIFFYLPTKNFSFSAFQTEKKFFLALIVCWSTLKHLAVVMAMLFFFLPVPRTVNTQSLFTIIFANTPCTAVKLCTTSIQFKANPCSLLSALRTKTSSMRSKKLPPKMVVLKSNSVFGSLQMINQLFFFTLSPSPSPFQTPTMCLCV